MPLDQKPKQEIWQQHINDWRQSRLSQREYCKQKDISFSSFGYWRTRLNRTNSPAKKLIPVTVGRPSASIAVFLPSGIRLDVPSHALADVLPIVYRTVQASPG